MPNILAHGYITSAVRGESWLDINLGSTLPDFTSMYKDYRGKPAAVRGVSDVLDVGIELHGQTDIIYDRQEEKPKITTLLSADLSAEGISPAAARLSAAFLGDVMLDGVLLDFDAPKKAFLRLARHILSGETALKGKEIPLEFTGYVEDYFKRGLPADYARPPRLAVILQDRLNRRARVSLAAQNNTISPEQIPDVAAVIGRHMGSVGELGLAALEQTVISLRATQDT